jgi:WD40 repeat protein
MERIWSPCLQTLEGHSDRVWSVAFSPDSARLASGSADRTVKIWDASSGKCLQTLEGHSDWVCSVAFSPDSARLASGSADHTVKIWDASSGECLQTLEVGTELFEVSFDVTGSYLHTEIGVISIDAPSVTDPQSPRYQGWALSSDRTWITYDSDNWVCLPLEYRSKCSAVSGKTIAIGTGSGKVWICSFKVANVQDLRNDSGAPHWQHPFGPTPPWPIGPVPRGGLAVVARAHKCSRSNVSILFFLNLAVANLYRRFWCCSL